MMDAALIGRRILEAAVFPPGGALILLALAVLLMGRRPRAGRVLAATACVVLWLSGTRGFGEVLLAPLEDAYPALTAQAVAEALAGADPPRAIVVLGGGTQRDVREQPWQDKPRAHTLARLVHGAWLARESGLPMLLSGGRVFPDRPSEAEVMARVSREVLHVEPRWLEEASLDSLGNARESARILTADHVHSIVLVSTAAHLPRAVATFEAAGLKVLPAPTDFSGRAQASGPVSPVSWMDWMPSATGAEDVWYGLHEWTGMLWYRLRSGIVRSRTPTMSRSETS